MTREEAIENLNFQNEKFFGGQSEALKMAISALSENKGDLISRQAVEEINSEIPKIHELFDIAYEYNKEDSTRTELSQKCTTYLLDMWQTLGAIVDNYSPAENKGEWIEVVEERFPNGEKQVWHYECSARGTREPLCPINKEHWDFCPNCGAEMRAESDLKGWTIEEMLEQIRAEREEKSE